MGLMMQQKITFGGRLVNAVASLHPFTPGYPAWSPFPLKVQHPVFKRLSADSTIIPNLVDQLILNKTVKHLHINFITIFLFNYCWRFYLMPIQPLLHYTNNQPPTKFSQKNTQHALTEAPFCSGRLDGILRRSVTRWRCLLLQNGSMIENEHQLMDINGRIIGFWPKTLVIKHGNGHVPTYTLLSIELKLHLVAWSSEFTSY